MKSEVPDVAHTCSAAGRQDPNDKPAGQYFYTTKVLTNALINSARGTLSEEFCPKNSPEKVCTSLSCPSWHIGGTFLKSKIQSRDGCATTVKESCQSTQVLLHTPPTLFLHAFRTTAARDQSRKVIRTRHYEQTQPFL